MDNLNKYKFSTKKGFNGVLIKLRYKELQKYFRGATCLELGCSDGEGTKLLLKHFEKIVAVDGSSKAIIKARREIRNKKVQFVNTFFENLKLVERFDTIILAHILEHVDDPVSILHIAKKFLKKSGVVIVDVPNALSLHRQVGVLMGMIKNEYTLNKADLSIGHQRVYDLQTLRRDIKKAGLKVYKTGGQFIKPFSNAQMQKLLNTKGISAFDNVGKKFPEIAAEIFVICKLK